MPQTFINRIEQIVLSRIEEEGFSVGDLANELGLSRSQVLRKVKSSTGKSVNLFIREIRLRESAKLLQNSELNASEIAYKVGFSSPSYFNKCFHEFYACTPGEFRKKLEGKNHGYEEPAVPISNTRNNRPGVFLFTGAAIVLFVVLFTIFNKSLPGGNGQHQKASIAVLPFLSLSENNMQEHVADGITEAITLELSKHKTIRVISRTSAMRYKGEKILSSDIAKELDVNYLLEGSVLYSSDSLRVVVQLIEPFPNEKHLWAESYDQKYVDVLHLVKKISNEIAEMPLIKPLNWILPLDQPISPKGILPVNSIGIGKR